MSRNILLSQLEGATIILWGVATDAAKHFTTHSSVPTTRNPQQRRSRLFRLSLQAPPISGSPPETSRLVCVVSPAQATVLQPPPLCTPIPPPSILPMTQLYAPANGTTSKKSSMITRPWILQLCGQAPMSLNVMYVMSLTSCTGEDLRWYDQEETLRVTESAVCRAASWPRQPASGFGSACTGICFYLESVPNMKTSEPMFPASLNIQRAAARAHGPQGNNQRKQRAAARADLAGTPQATAGPAAHYPHSQDLSGPCRPWSLRPPTQSTPLTHPSLYKGKLRPKRDACPRSHSQLVAAHA